MKVNSLYRLAAVGLWLLATGGIAMPGVTFEHLVVDAQGPLNPHIKVAGDIDGDGSDDLVVPSSAGGPLVWYEAPEWKKHVIAESGKWSCDGKLVDMDGDGDLDLLIPEWYTYDRLEWYENPLPDGDPATDPWKLHIIGNPKAHDICVGDIDADGEQEIVTRVQGQAGNQVVVRKQVGGEWQNRVLPCPPGEGLALGDVDGDGRPDIFIGGRWYAAPVDAMAGEWPEHVFAEWPADAVVRLHDMNADGRLDVVLTRSEGPHRLSWFEAPDDPIAGKWQEHVVEASIDYAHSLVVCDLNGDGLPDIVTAEMHQSERKRVLVYLNQGDSAAWERHVLATTGSHNLCVARLADGRAVIAGANWSGPHQPVEAWEAGGLER
jgi:hypothetical protein